MSASSLPEDASSKKTAGQLAVTTLGALGIVFGDIGTSPLYALRECFHGTHGISLNPANIYGVLSLIVWALILVISVKYLIFVMRADNKGEGGILALMSLAYEKKQVSSKMRLNPILGIGLFGAALLYGDGIITPAISVLGAVEGLKIATPYFEPFVGVITFTILIALFLVQKKGTASIGRAFGPVILLWFVVLAVLGVKGILDEPSVLLAFNPQYGFQFLLDNSWHGFIVLGTVFLVVTGGEALYADMGHFGRAPIQFGWFCVALPALLLQYFGQGALLLKTPSAVENPFYLLAPSWALYPLVILATLAAVIASQALITGAFSMSHQAVQLGYLPRIEIRHTSSREMGQIYVPLINWLLCIGTLYLVFEFQTSSRLAAAYGIAVTATMVITTVLTYIVMRRRWNWSRLVALPFLALFFTIDIAFFGANAFKILDGGFVPLVIGAVIFALMTTWKKGRIILSERLQELSIPLDRFIKHIVPEVKGKSPGTAVFMTANFGITPPALLQNVTHNQVLHENIVLFTISTKPVPHVPDAERVQVKFIGDNFYTVVVHYGFMDSPNVPEALQLCSQHGLLIESKRTIFFLGRETLIATHRPGMAIWREHIFAFMARNAQRATDYFQIPSNQVVEIGTVVEL
ncbi:MAG: potassium transporter Kup [Oligoflexus sp.]|nr:potassium transporter Kup [Oligoflexus sp.]